MAQEYFSITGVNTFTSPMAGDDGILIHSLNMVSFPYGAKSKRPGYNTFQGTADGSQIQRLFSFPRGDGTTLTLHRVSGTNIYYSTQGTSAWATCSGYGTVGAGNYFDYDIIYDQNSGSQVLVGNDGQGTVRWTSDGTTFNATGGSTPNNYQYFTEYHGRIYASGTQFPGTLLYSSANSGTQWTSAPPYDSSFVIIPSSGAPTKSFVTGDKLFIPKNKGKMFNWDEYNLIDMSTTYSPSSPQSIASIEDYYFWINQYGHFGFDGAQLQLLSNPVQRYFYNSENTGIAGSQLANAPGVTHIYDYYVSMGTIQDDFTHRGVNNAILNYNYQKNEYLLHQFANFPTAWHSYFDTNNKVQLIFGDKDGQVYQLDPTATSDNGNPINCELVLLYTYNGQSTAITPTSQTNVDATAYEKKWDWIRLYFNPGCEANIQFAVSNSFTYENLIWQDIVDPTPNTQNIGGDGVVEFRFPQGTRGRVLFVRIYESSLDSKWTYYGCQIDAEPVVH